MCDNQISMCEVRTLLWTRMLIHKKNTFLKKNRMMKVPIEGKRAIKHLYSSEITELLSFWQKCHFHFAIGFAQWPNECSLSCSSSNSPFIFSIINSFIHNIVNITHRSILLFLLLYFIFIPCPLTNLQLPSTAQSSSLFQSSTITTSSSSAFASSSIVDNAIFKTSCPTFR